MRYLTYPECQGWPCRDGRPAPARTVAFDYRYGYPLAIGDPLTLPLESAPDPDLLGDYYPVSDGSFLGNLRYQLGGLPHKVEYGNGVTWTQTADEDGMSRPQVIQTTGVVGAAVADLQAAGNWSTSTYSYDGINTGSDFDRSTGLDSTHAEGRSILVSAVRDSRSARSSRFGSLMKPRNGAPRHVQY